MPFCSTEEGQVSGETTFESLVTNLLPNANREIMVLIAEECCRECGGLPEDCTCIEDVLATTAWTTWPAKVADIIAGIVSQMPRPTLGGAHA